MGPVYGTHPIWGGERGGVAGPGAYIPIIYMANNQSISYMNVYKYIYIYTDVVNKH